MRPKRLVQQCQERSEALIQQQQQLLRQPKTFASANSLYLQRYRDFRRYRGYCDTTRSSYHILTVVNILTTVRNSCTLLRIAMRFQCCCNERPINHIRVAPGSRQLENNGVVIRSIRTVVVHTTFVMSSASWSIICRAFHTSKYRHVQLFLNLITVWK